MNPPPLIIALDLPTPKEALALVDRLGPTVPWYKIGPVLFVDDGPTLVREIQSRGKKVFLDLKFHDIPNTVEHACAAAARLGVDLLTIHLGGGAGMIQGALKGVAGTKTQVLGVSVLTSVEERVLRDEMGVPRTPAEQVFHLVSLGLAQGIHGIVCSPEETAALRAKFGGGFHIVNPGIRGSQDPVGDQKRTASARDAIARGATHLVIGRPVTAHADPVARYGELSKEIQGL